MLLESDPVTELQQAAQPNNAATAIEDAHWTAVADSIVPGMTVAAVESAMGNVGTVGKHSEINGKATTTRQWTIARYTFEVEFVDGVVSKTAWR